MVMKKIFYEKVGRRYKPVREYDNDFLDSVPKGSHLVMSYPGGKSTRYNIDPNYAAMIAAGRVAEDLATQLDLTMTTMLAPESKFFKQHYRSNWHNQGVVVREMDVIRNQEGW
jgi:hypothetical protein